ncbi:MAG TPA: hypothetical protein VGH99_05160 [Pseudonocardia sp.]|jgi:hypothetical protein
MIVMKIAILTVLILGGGFAIWQFSRQKSLRRDGTPYAKRRRRLPVTDRKGNRYVPVGDDGWLPEKRVRRTGVKPMTFSAMTQKVQGGELHVDRRAEKPAAASNAADG